MILIRQLSAEQKKTRLERHRTRLFHKVLDQTIEKCQQEDRKFYIIGKGEASFEVLGAQELKKLRKFAVVRKDENFMDLSEKAVVVSKETLNRQLTEQSFRNKWYKRWWFRFWGLTMHTGLTQCEVDSLRRLRQRLIIQNNEILGTDIGEDLKQIINRYDSKRKIQ
jgi:hypothetical protein